MEAKERFQQYFTPPEVTAAMWRVSGWRAPRTILEPSCGTGSLMAGAPIGARARACGVEIDPSLIPTAQAAGIAEVHCADAIRDRSWERGRRFDLVMLVSPWGIDIDGVRSEVAFLRAAMDRWVAPNGRIVALLHADIVRRRKMLSVWNEFVDRGFLVRSARLVDGCHFEAQGSPVRVGIVVADAPSVRD